MRPRYEVLAARIRAELREIARVESRVDRALRGAREHPEHQDAFLDSCALNLHDFYCGIERILERVARTVDEVVPTGRDWHRELLRQMAVPVPGLRPAVLPDSTARALQEYLGFRHVVRNVYAFQFDPERLQRLGENLPTVSAGLRAALSDFCRFLEGIAAGDKD
ncbi:ribonuclease toxin HepT-like protein [Deferrisoma camini]|uniref:ribonuclease toxin HepT-like protein n=1 Tax=Deferrisoma camini TaxID=1035120 RepID=UPI00046CE55D|nr:hypothetical protein [Deferrisoma camini]